MVERDGEADRRRIQGEAVISEACKQALFKLAIDAGNIGDSLIRSFSGADQADSEAYFCERRVYIDVALGKDLEDSLTREDARWRSYAKEQVAKVAAAPKIRRGPSQGHSVIAHRWVDSEKFAGKMGHIRFMVRKTLAEHAAQEVTP